MSEMRGEDMALWRRLASSTVAVVLALGVAAAVRTPAQAVPPNCEQSQGHEEVAGYYVLAYNWWYCDDGKQIAWPASVSRYVSPGVYETLVSARGDAIYYCTGTAYNVYRVGNREFGVLCS
jgi:hypothetical protein